MYNTNAMYSKPRESYYRKKSVNGQVSVPKPIREEQVKGYVITEEQDEDGNPVIVMYPQETEPNAQRNH
jgi:hypothetical protein